ncbi:type II toxin-antitoxin system Phd/YefM family antitoxin [Pirellulaceae bacterium SH449]
MTHTITLEEAEQRLRALLSELHSGDELIITDNNVPIAKLVLNTPTTKSPRIPGLGKGMITVVSDDEDHLQDFTEYMR